jgi:hypothetical protein
MYTCQKSMVVYVPYRCDIQLLLWKITKMKQYEFEQSIIMNVINCTLYILQSWSDYIEDKIVGTRNEHVIYQTNEHFQLENFKGSGNEEIHR